MTRENTAPQSRILFKKKKKARNLPFFCFVLSNVTFYFSNSSTGRNTGNNTGAHHKAVVEKTQRFINSAKN